MGDDRWFDRALEFLMSLPFCVLERAHGNPLVKIIGIVVFIVLTFPCIAMAFPFLMISVGHMMWHEFD